LVELEVKSPKGAHSGMRSQQLRGRSQRGDIVNCGHLWTEEPEEGVKELADVRKLALFIIVVGFVDALYL